MLPNNLYPQSCITIDQQPGNILLVDNEDVVIAIDASSTEGLSYQWQIFNTATNLWEDIFDDFDYTGTNSSTLTITNITPSINGSRFRVNINGQSPSCIETIEIRITYIQIKVNNIFTPNDDGFNDFLNINGILQFENSKLQVYNRWGNLVYEKIGYQNDWNGIANTGNTINGSKKLPVGTYFYTLDLKFDNKKLSGWLYINR